MGAKGHRLAAAGCVEGLWKKVFKMDGPSAQGFLSLTAFQAEGCGGGFAADLKKGGAADAAGCVEGLWKKVLGFDGPCGPEGCGLPCEQCL